MQFKAFNINSHQNFKAYQRFLNSYVLVTHIQKNYCKQVKQNSLLGLHIQAAIQPFLNSPQMFFFLSHFFHHLGHSGMPIHNLKGGKESKLETDIKI